MAKVWKFKSEDRFHISGRGTVFTTTVPENIPTDEVMGQLISVDGVLYMCRGIERFALYLGNPILEKGHPIGLLVSEAKGTHV